MRYIIVESNDVTFYKDDTIKSLIFSNQSKDLEIKICLPYAIFGTFDT